ncbi:hypothetical protein HAV15_001186 [Penicillium sp. str. |nr:hypothetical protein HAV15_001186 [Penicillium sp. str. \
MSEQYTSFALSSVAERIRKQIKEMLPRTGAEGSDEEKPEKAQKLPNKIEGGVMYGGNILLKRVLELVKEMGSANIGKDWRWTVAHFYEATEILNDSFQMYLIPLSPNSTSGIVEEGHAAFIRNKPILNAGASVIIITPPL